MLIPIHELFRLNRKTNDYELTEQIFTAIDQINDYVFIAIDTNEFGGESAHSFLGVDPE